MPDIPMCGHLLEMGFNGINFCGARNCWARNIEIANCDSAVVFEKSKNCEVRQLKITGRTIPFETERHGVLYSMYGHHGISFDRCAADNMVNGFTFDSTFFHDITANHKASGNVICNGSGPDINFDHHRDAPFENLFSNINVGNSTRLYESTGNPLTGPHSGARETFWNIKSEVWENPPPPDESQCSHPWSHIQINVIPCSSNMQTSDREWQEPLENIGPKELYSSQLAYRKNNNFQRKG
jgi:hypothetical protein